MSKQATLLSLTPPPQLLEHCEINKDSNAERKITVKAFFLLSVPLPGRTLSYARLCVCNRQVCGRPGQKEVEPVHYMHDQADVRLLVQRKQLPLSAVLLHRLLNTDHQMQQFS